MAAEQRNAHARRRRTILLLCIVLLLCGVGAEGYLLISAYCHTHRHNSVIYVLDLETHKYIKEIVLQGRSHVGAIAYDPVHRNVWVASYDEENKKA